MAQKTLELHSTTQRESITVRGSHPDGAVPGLTSPLCPPCVPPVFYTCYGSFAPFLCHATTRDPTAPYPGNWTRLGKIFPLFPSSKSGALLIRPTRHISCFLYWGAGYVVAYVFVHNWGEMRATSKLCVECVCSSWNTTATGITRSETRTPCCQDNTCCADVGPGVFYDHQLFIHRKAVGILR